MKLNLFTTFLSIFLAGIVSFFLSSYLSGQNKTIVGIGSFISIAIPLIGFISTSFEYDRTTTLTKTTSGLFLIVLLISQIIFTSIKSFLLPTYILVNGSLIVLYTLVFYGIVRSKH